MKQIVVLFVIACLSVAGSIEPELVGLMHSSTDTDLIPVFIVLHGRVDRNWVNFATMGMNRAERQQFAVSALKEMSEISQQGILEQLKAYNADNVTNINPLWLSNSIYCEVTPAVIKALAERTDIVVIERGAGDVTSGLIEPVEVRDLTPEEAGNGLAWGVAKINADDAWAEGYEGNGVIVAVIDTGVDYNHTDLVTNMWSDAQGYHGYDFFDEDTDPMDDYGHGTHCAGSVAGMGAAGTETGVAPSSVIMAIRINYYGGGEYTWIQGMEFAADNGASVMSMSLGSDAGNTSLRTANENVLAAGVYHSVAAGNNGFQGAGSVLNPGDNPPPWFHPDQTYHGGMSAVVTVGATDNNDNIASFSSRGPVTWWSDYSDSSPLIDPDISGPGVNVVSTQWTGGYTTMSGTSMATPHLAGVAALILSANPNLTVAQMDSIIEVTSVDLGASGKDNTYGAGRVDAYQACLAAASISSIEKSAPSPSVSLSAISPNPVSNFAAFSVYTDVTAAADISVFDVSGRRIANIETAEITSGVNAYNWQIPGEMGSGIYFVRATVNGTTASSRMTVLR